MNFFGITFKNFIITPGYVITGYEADLVMDDRIIAHCIDNGSMERTKITGLSREDETEFKKRMDRFFEKYPVYISNAFVNAKDFDPEDLAFVEDVDFMVDMLANFVQYEADFYDAAANGAQVVVRPQLPLFSEELVDFDEFTGFTNVELANQYMIALKNAYDEINFLVFTGYKDFILT